LEGKLTFFPSKSTRDVVVGSGRGIVGSGDVVAVSGDVVVDH